MSLGFGYRARIGHIYPSGGVSDHEIQAMAPDGVQFITTRVAFADTSRDALLAMVDSIADAAKLVADAGVDLIAFNCTAAGMLLGKERIFGLIREATGVPAVTTSDAVESALAVLKARNIALFTPYRPEVIEDEKRFLSDIGITVVAEAHLSRGTPVEQGSIPPAEWRELAATVDTRGCDALLFSCGGMQIAPAVAQIEAEHGVPVVSSNSALLWQVLGRLNIREDTGRYGRLFDHAAPMAGPVPAPPVSTAG